MLLVLDMQVILRQLAHHKEILVEMVVTKQQVAEVEQELVEVQLVVEQEEVEEMVQQIQFQVHQLLIQVVVEEVELIQEMVQEDRVEQVEEEQEEMLQEIMEQQELLIQEAVEEVEQEEIVLCHHLVVQVVQVLLLLEHQDQQIFLQDQEQTQLQHYRHPLEVVKLRHLRFLEHLQLANNSST
jgi:hypothetical protein